MTLTEVFDLAIEALETGKPAAAKEILIALNAALKEGRIENFFSDFDPCKDRLLIAAQELALKRHEERKKKRAQFNKPTNNSPSAA